MSDQLALEFSEMTDDDPVDLIARYLVCKLSLLLETDDRYAGAEPRRARKWETQLEETKRQLIANGLATQI